MTDIVYNGWDLETTWLKHDDVYAQVINEEISPDLRLKACAEYIKINAALDDFICFDQEAWQKLFYNALTALTIQTKLEEELTLRKR